MARAVPLSVYRLVGTADNEDLDELEQILDEKVLEVVSPSGEVNFDARLYIVKTEDYRGRA